MNTHTAHDAVPASTVIYSPPERQNTSHDHAAIRRQNRGIMAKKKPKKAAKRSALATLPKPDAKVRDYEAHVLVCKGGDCKKRGSKDVRKALKNELRASGMNRDVRVDGVECLGFCKHGPNAIVYPPGTWYLGLIAADAPEIVEKHLKDGEPVEHLAAEFRGRKR